MKYRVNEIFYSLQGEGQNAGRAAVFVRFAGCNLRCPFCDTNFRNFIEITEDEIAEKAHNEGGKCDFLVLTGGEPTLQVNIELILKLRQYFKYIAIETNGTRPIPAGIDFVTISPKEDFVKGGLVMLGAAQEVKVVFDGKSDPSRWLSSIRAGRYYLQPCDTGNEEENKHILAECINYIAANPQWRLSLQIHKIIGVR